MRSTRVLTVSSLGILLACAGLSPTLFALDINAAQAHAIQINVPVKLEKANVVFNMDHLAFSGDVPVGIKYMHLLANRFAEQSTKGQIIGVFHGDAAYWTLNDSAYDAYRSVSTGNPYKALISELLRQGVQVEECAVSMKAHNWGNDDLLPGVKVNTGAVIRLVQLTQEGYAQIQP